MRHPLLVALLLAAPALAGCLAGDTPMGEAAGEPRGLADRDPRDDHPDSATGASDDPRSRDPRPEDRSDDDSVPPFEENQGQERLACRERPVNFTSLPMRSEDFATLIPYGHLAGAHVTPIDHMYFAPATARSPRDAYEVRAVAEGTIVEIGHRTMSVGEAPHAENVSEYRVVLAPACGLTIVYDLLTSLSPPIEVAYREAGFGRGRLSIPVKSGDAIGRIGGQTLDFGVYDERVTLEGFLVPSRYDREPWKIHTVDPFPFFEEAVREILLDKLVRQAEPRAGRIDLDRDGRLVGNWFKQGTNGYAGTHAERYWDGHLAIVYDHIDPTQVRFSTGDYAGVARQFGVKGNGPDPANVSVATGLVVYELVQYSHVDLDRPQEPWLMDRVAQRPAARNAGDVVGVALVQLVEDRLLKVEIFPGQRASSVVGFTDGAILYER